MFAYAHRARFGDLVDREVDEFAAMVGESESCSSIKPGQDGLKRDIVASAPGNRQDLGGEILGVLTWAAARKVTYERGGMLADHCGEPRRIRVMVGGR